MNSKRVQGIPVISIADGTKLGAVDNVYFDPAKKQVVGFSVGSAGGLLAPEGGTIVDVVNVRSLGPDALTVSDKSTMGSDLTTARYADLTPLSHLMKRRVVTEGGVYVGQIASVEFDEKSFTLTQVEASPGFFKSNKSIAAPDVLSIGTDLVVVADAICAVDVHAEPVASTSAETAPRRGTTVEYYPKRDAASDAG